MSLIVNWRRIPPRIPLESAGIPEFRLIPADSPRNTWIPWIPPGIRGESVGEWKVLPLWYQWQFHSILGGDFNRKINNYELAISNRIISLPGGNPQEIITYHCDITSGFIQYLAGISIHGIIGWNQWLSARDFKTKSLVYRWDIHVKSLLTLVVLMAVSFNTW